MAIITQQIFGSHAVADGIASENAHFYNPFSITRSLDKFSNSIDSLSLKIRSFAKDVFQELVFINPYKMSIGNILAAYKNRHIFRPPLEKAFYYTEVTILVLGSLIYSSLLFYLAGAALKGSSILVGNSSSSICVYAEKILLTSGEFFQKQIAKNLFLGGTVPIYATFYRFPKWIITTALPELAKLSHRGLKILTEKIFNVAKLIFEKLIVPFAKLIQKVLNTLWNKVIEPFLKIALKALKEVVSRISEVIKWTFDNLVIPFAKLMEKALSALWNYVIEPIGRMAIKYLQEIIFRILNVIKWTFDNLIIPFIELMEKALSDLWNYLIEPIGRTTLQALKWMVLRIADIINWTISNVMKPIFIAFESLSIYIWRNVILPLGKLTEICFKAICNVASYVFDYLLMPLWDVIKKCSFFTSGYIIQPILKCVSSIVIFIADLISTICSNIFTHLIQPAAQAFAYAALQLTQFIAETSASLYSATARVFALIFG